MKTKLIYSGWRLRHCLQVSNYMLWWNEMEVLMGVKGMSESVNPDTTSF